ncbi:LLM class flavin-dependent oxidoreductase [Mycobacterium avium]|uniref:LLM class flavin-dependent oxidoreductase n=1 Tax=Mycobacterium avium TaxID=1764 RepID=UPI0003D219CC|nr:LLM class flavin-dependent oxidoreductase [Mycobacterium avium]ETA90111.1 coenzyme F420-dependent N(5),N(10)-methylenetetrahydromethanopterin reductase [Mycobacterium avium 05-4293]MDV3303012.1 LLM class flavin-dependent oxidoreductase [Mycobacterium avium subsp. hominissuis]PBA13779.1 LLM class flavin-dependent oxidoreductase [Mycobacterium avium]PBA89821.1 LLM class flavin-dependent oxidoreductase [Mycobacterium avium]PBJ47005.1 LLM class flavin-dependent oxidoreductase [Mycobacterium avi
MTDYGHEPLFGAFIAPVNAPASRAVDLAVAADDAGLDVVTFQDHPYQAGFHDTWTLMSYVAARTRRIRIAGNVLNLPLRPPAVLARSAASLDLLSDGRIEMALGAGGFWDPIVAMGGSRRTPGQALHALDEAIEVMRQMWDTTSAGPIRVDGEHYRVSGVKRGPQPAHRIEIWVGGYGQRMLKLIGRRADGWLPSVSYLAGGFDDIATLGAVIDAAAVAAGRQPHDIRRLINVGGQFSSRRDGFLYGPPDSWAEDLAGLIVGGGASGFIFPADDEATIGRIAGEVAPATRELVAAARSAA